MLFLKEIFERSSIINYCIRLKILHQKINKTIYRFFLKKIDLNMVSLSIKKILLKIN